MALSWKITNGSFKELDFHVAVPAKGKTYGVTDQEITNERRLQVSEQAMVAGADVEDFDRKAMIFTATIVFFGADYMPLVKAFEDKLNEGTSGVLLLPEMHQAVWAKYQKHTRKTAASDGGSTVLSVTWIEDRPEKPLAANPTDDAQAAIANGNPSQAVPTVLDAATAANSHADLSLAALKNNAFLNALSNFENQVVSSRLKVNSYLNMPKITRQNLMSSAARLKGELTALKSSINGISSYFSDSFGSGSGSTATRYNTGLGSLDFKAVDNVSTAVVAGGTVIQSGTEHPTQIQSNDDALKKLKDSVAIVADATQVLEKDSSGATLEISQRNRSTINAVKDLIKMLEPAPTTPVLVMARTSLLEVCFYNGLSVNDVERVYKINTHLDDNLDIPSFTVVNL